ncbi:MAG: sigma-70 family RNA polymerase sigma factor [Rhodovibrionaceae bacterium]
MSRTLFLEMEALIPNLRAYARMLTHNRANADDLVQACLERAIDKIASFEPGTNLKGWLFTILRNLYINDCRRAARWEMDSDPADMEDLFPAAASQMNSLALQEFLQAFERLKEEERSLLLMVAVEGLSYEETARMLDVPVGTVRSRLSRARGHLRELLGGGEAERLIAAYSEPQSASA